MFDVYELYGYREANLQEVRNQVSRALDIAFEFHDSYYLNEYFLGKSPSGQRITIESNELEDEDGSYLQEPEFVEYGTLVRFEYKAPVQINEEPGFDELSSELRVLQDLTLPERNFAPAEN